MSRAIRYHHIPPCGGLHTAIAVRYCPDCTEMTYKAEMLTLKRREIELREIALDVGPREPRKPYVPYVPAPVPEQKPPIRRRGL